MRISDKLILAAVSVTIATVIFIHFVVGWKFFQSEEIVTSWEVGAYYGHMAPPNAPSQGTENLKKLIRGRKFLSRCLDSFQTTRESLPEKKNQRVVYVEQLLPIQEDGPIDIDISLAEGVTIIDADVFLENMVGRNTFLPCEKKISLDPDPAYAPKINIVGLKADAKKGERVVILALLEKKSGISEDKPPKIDDFQIQLRSHK